MTNEYYECKIQYDKTTENGLVKKVSEVYLVEAFSFADAEERFIKEITPYMSGEFEVASVNKRKYSEFFNREKDFSNWYKAKLSFITLDEKSGREKESITKVLVRADSFHEALEGIDEGMKGSMMDYTIKSIIEIPYMDFFKLEN